MLTQTIAQLLTSADPDRTAIAAPNQAGLTFRALTDLSRRVGDTLTLAAIGPGDCVAIVLPNGPEAATSFLTIACHATTAPLNPAYKADEFSFYLEDLQAKALVVLSGADTPARHAAAALSIPVFELQPQPTAAGDFTLIPPACLTGQPAREARAVGPDDIALVLHTSGTTARPKIVPLSHANLLASARHIAQTLQLDSNDVCLNIMPLFHIHGLIAAVLSSVAAGGTVVCTPGLSGFRFFTWLKACKPTWYTAVPTMHQALLDLAPRFKDAITSAPLRFIRSSSASLPPPVMAELEAAFGIPVIEAYGMTEAAHQMASNPLPPMPRIPGSVGLPAGPDIAIMGPEGQIMPQGKRGEVVIRGPNVMGGYARNPSANETAFTDGWFRTGDEGMLDAHGYLFLTGRLKEIINRAGEKIAPIEVDNVLQSHPAVLQVVTFAMPSKTFGEDVAAAVVLRDTMTVSEEELRDHVARHLAPFKVPRKIVFLPEIPKGATGKLQRIGLAARLGVSD
jgi:oxalate---CoA ligase